MCLRRRFLPYYGFLIPLLGVYSVWAQAQTRSTPTVEELSERIEALERTQLDLLAESSDRRAPVRSFFRDQLTLGGFFEPTFTMIAGPNTKTQAAGASNSLGLNLSAEFTPELRFASQFITGLFYTLNNLNNQPAAARLGLPAQREFGSVLFAALLAQAYLEYESSQAFRIQGGLGYVPFGHAFQQREPVLFVRRAGPQMLRTSEILSPLWNGLHIYGSVPMSGMRWGYNAYSFTPVLNSKVPGAGARTWVGSPSGNFTFGLSTQLGKRRADTYKTLGSDFKFRIGFFEAVTEYARQFVRADDPWATYFEPRFYLLDDSWIIFAFADYAESPLSELGSGATRIADPHKKWEYGGGLNWLPTSYTRIRLAYFLFNYVGSSAVVASQNRDFWALDLSGGIAF